MPISSSDLNFRPWQPEQIISFCGRTRRANGLQLFPPPGSNIPREEVVEDILNAIRYALSKPPNCGLSYCKYLDEQDLLQHLIEQDLEVYEDMNEQQQVHHQEIRDIDQSRIYPPPGHYCIYLIHSKVNLLVS